MKWPVTVLWFRINQYPIEILVKNLTFSSNNKKSNTFPFKGKRFRKWLKIMVKTLVYCCILCLKSEIKTALDTRT